MGINSLLILIGKNIKRLRGEMSQGALAKKAGISRTTIQNIEGGKSIGLDNILRIARALNIDPADLFLSNEDRQRVTYKAKLFWEEIDAIKKQQNK